MGEAGLVIYFLLFSSLSFDKLNGWVGCDEGALEFILQDNDGLGKLVLEAARGVLSKTSSITVHRMSLGMGKMGEMAMGE